MKSQSKAYLYALLAIGAWSTIATAFHLTLRHIGFMELLMYAGMTSTLVFAAYLAVQGKLVTAFRKPVRHLAAMALAGFLNPYLYYLLLLRAYELLPAQEAGTLNYFWPVVLVLLSIPLLGQKIGWKGILAVLVSFAGIVVISTHGRFWELQFSNPSGVLLALTCPFIWALYWILNIKIPGPDIEKLFIGFLTGTLLITLTYTLLHPWQLPSFKGLAGSVYAGIFEMGLTFILWLKALKHSRTTAHISNLVFLSPFLSLFFIQIIVGEEILMTTLAGLALIVAGILLQQYGDLRRHMRKTDSA